MRIEPEGGHALAAPFVVECRTHSYGIHSEHSKRRDTRVVATEEWTPLRTGLRSPVISAQCVYLSQSRIGLRTS